MKKILFLFPIAAFLAAGCNAQQVSTLTPVQIPVTQNANQSPPSLTPTPSPIPTSTPAAVPTNPSNLLVTVNNSGSTNALPYAINIFADGSASALVQNKPAQNFPAGTVDVKTLRALLQNIGDVSQIDGHCAKSVSFGTITTITYNKKTSGDISCVFTGTVYNLYTFISQLEQQLKISTARRAVQNPL
jgi:hypothetical protein